MEDNNPNSDLSQLEELRTQVSLLQQKLDDANVINQAMWSLLVETSRRLQISSGAIKTAVSSLLGYDIFWDGSTQHELLEIINDSADQVSDQITLLALTFRSEAKSLEIQTEPNEIQEILSPVLDTIIERYPELELEVDITQKGNPILVNYEYLSVALKLLFEVLVETPKVPQRFRVVTREIESGWYLDILGVSNDVLDFLSTGPICLADDLTQNTWLLPTNRLKLLVMCRIFSLQSIKIDANMEMEHQVGIRLFLPHV